MAALQSEADRILETIKEKRNTKACYPRAKRKIRCSGGQPCSTCSQRNHPDICHYFERDAKRTKRKRDTRSVENSACAGPTTEDTSTQQSNLPQHQNSSPESATPTRSLSNGNYAQPIPRQSDTTTLGSHTMASFLDDRLQNARPGLGLQNHSPGMRDAGFVQNGAEQATSDIVAICPKRSEVFRFFPIYRSNVVPFTLKDGDSLELAMFRFLADFESAGADGDMRLRKFAETQRNRISVYLSALALGAQMSELSAAERARYADDFVHRSIAALRFPGMVLFPCFQGVQALLMIGMCYQNAGSSDASWTLLGLTFRLAQSLGLHSPTNEKHDLWKSIIWQDTLLSLRFGRTPLQTAYNANKPERWIPSAPIDSYVDAMHALNAIGLAYMSSSGLDRADMGHIQGWMEALESLRHCLPPYLRSLENCSNLQQTLHFYAFRMHISFLEAEMCRPCMMHNKSGDGENLEVKLGERALAGMQATLSAYLDMSRLSVLPLRNWSLIQESLSCACVLALLKISRNDQEVQRLLDRVIRLLETELSNAGNQTLQGNWTCSTALKLLKASRAYKEKPEDPSERNHDIASLGERGETQRTSTDGHAPPTVSNLPTAESQPGLLWSGSPFDNFDVPFSSFFEWSSELFENGIPETLQ